jgi:hypothetical protein
MAAALIGAVAVSVPLGAQGASAASGPDAGDPNNGTDPAAAIPQPVDPPDLGADGGNGSTPTDGTGSAPTGSSNADAQCGEVTFTSTLPTVITCGPVTITFNTVTTTTTVTTVSAPITAANGPINTATTNNTATPTSAPATPRKCSMQVTSKRPKRRKTRSARKRATFVVKSKKGQRTVRFRLLFAPRARY